VEGGAGWGLQAGGGGASGELDALAWGCGAVLAGSLKQAVGHQSVDVGVKIKVFAEGVQRQDDARHAPQGTPGPCEGIR